MPLASFEPFTHWKHNQITIYYFDWDLKNFEHQPERRKEKKICANEKKNAERESEREKNTSRENQKHIQKMDKTERVS